ncbi:3'(2'),5'-bisphosphate nucleotidase CysQ [Maritalea mediterranea]|uniref:3'(2'),5'-bisphosphate nucleotidase CysQ n=1 Tax=Maritalea mediterranea TaxID=2909667 RepID=A0ABS9E5B6_9HYPH|nr:3'(2'),5'-bisphosphate nucleotidase CysQ [Maritalea mediterranea]MCF4098046.1 3'(2'),5'-bisphosphate nucleotidase CysQ [Maritalea mediterranea]
MPTFSALAQQMLEAALAASQTILAHYQSHITVARKEDGSPVTAADAAGEAVIIERLRGLNIPVLGEESVAAGKIPTLGERFFVVDPLDGTKEFIKRNGEFTVNIALVEDHIPTHGVIIAPAMNTAYYGGPEGAFKSIIVDAQFGQWTPIATDPQMGCKIVASRSHAHGAIKYFLDEAGPCEDVSVGSSLKFCLVAEGAALHYPRFTPTCEWDIAAGHAILAQAGGALIEANGGPMRYGKTEVDFLNPYFAAAASPAHAQECASIMRQALEKAR